jgi:tripartite-type tricarboxylate transporter receptor subunit TctC
VTSGAQEWTCRCDDEDDPHRRGELFRTAAKLDMIHIPYKGSAPAITDLSGGHVPVMFDSTIAILPHIKSEKLKAIAVTGAKRSPQLPDIPTFAEAGLPAVLGYVDAFVMYKQLVRQLAGGAWPL